VGAVPPPLAVEPDAQRACELSGVTKAFGAVRAVDDVSLGFAEGSLTCLIGPNGAGKSTLLGCISGFHAVGEGIVRVDGRDVTR
jgi:ABC-type Fe3+/spermidine/putrescine transport system ATPase subunit